MTCRMLTRRPPRTSRVLTSRRSWIVFSIAEAHLSPSRSWEGRWVLLGGFGEENERAEGSNGKGTKGTNLAEHKIKVHRIGQSGE